MLHNCLGTKTMVVTYPCYILSIFRDPSPNADKNVFMQMLYLFITALWYKNIYDNCAFLKKIHWET